MYQAKDVVRFNSFIAGKEKFHICIKLSEDGERNFFLFVNSEGGFEGDLVLDDGEIPGLPKSRTGQSVVSFSQVIRMDDRQLNLAGAERVGEIDDHLVGDLLAFARSCRALSDYDKELVVHSLENVLGN